MKILAAAKPEYLMNPRQFMRRLRLAVVPIRGERALVRLPWGWEIEVRCQDDIGRALIHLGIYDLVVAETLWRLCDTGESALDLGANIGAMTALLAKRLGPAGHVRCFEAHPEIIEELRSNVDRWKDAGGAEIQIRGAALSDHAGTVQFEVPEDFNRQRGLSRVLDPENPDRIGSKVLTVPSVTLDSALEGLGDIGVAKMDVEGHEKSVLLGAKAALESRRIRDWIFEHHPAYPSAVTDLFETHGYTVLEIRRGFSKPVLTPLPTTAKRSDWEATNFLATADPARALARMEKRGWQILKVGDKRKGI
jgi:FkbM family methyltransferase